LITGAKSNTNASPHTNHEVSVNDDDLECDEVEFLHDSMHEPAGSLDPSGDEEDEQMHENHRQEKDAVPERDVNSSDVIDLCFSQCYSRPPLRAITPCRTSAPSASETAAQQAAAIPSAANRAAATGGHAAGDTSLPNALSILMQSSRSTASKSCANAEGPEPAKNALSLMMSSARRYAQEHQATGGSGEAGVWKHKGRGGSGKGLKDTGAGVRSAGVDPNAVAPWVTVKSSGPVHIIEVPYSEHSSFNELRCVT
jgi:DNA repair metallo-beta-lactamase